MVNPSGGSARRGAELALALIFISRRSSCERFVIRALGVISCHHVRRVWADGKAYRLQKVIIPANLGRKVSPKRDQSGKPAKRDRRRREAGLFTL